MAMVIVNRVQSGKTADKQAHFLREQVEKMCQANNQYTDAVVALMRNDEFDLDAGVQMRNKLYMACDTTALLMSRVINKFGLNCKEVKVLTDIMGNFEKMLDDVSVAFFDNLTNDMDYEASVEFFSRLGFDTNMEDDKDIESNEEPCCCGNGNCDECNTFDPDTCAECVFDNDPDGEEMPDEVRDSYDAVSKLNNQFEKCFAYDEHGEFDPVKATKLIGKMETAKQRLYILMASVVQNTPAWVDFVREMMDDLDIMKESIEALIEADVTSAMDNETFAAFEAACFNGEVDDDCDGDGYCCCEVCGMDHTGVEEVLNALTTVVGQLTDAVNILHQNTN